MYICDCCNFKTTRLFNYQRHLSRATHERQVFLTLENNDSFTPGTIEVEPPLDLFVSTVIEEDLLIHAPSLSRSKESDNDYQENHETADDNENCNSDGPSDKAPTWYPFSSKAEMLLYIFMNSTTHPVSHEVVKFVMFMMKELKVEGIPSIQKLSSMNIGDLSWEDLVTKDTDKENVPFWVIKPSEVVRLSVAHPDVAKSLIRYPQQSNQNVHPSTSSKWRDDILFKTASYGQKVFVKGNIYSIQEGLCTEYGRVEKFRDNLQTSVFEALVTIIIASNHTDVEEYHLPEQSLVETMQKRYIPVSLLKPADIQSIKHAYRISRGSLTELKDEDFTAFVHLETSLPVLSVPINLFLDDTSTNKSRRWLALHCVQMQLAGLPLLDRHKEGNVHFLGASEKTEIMDVAQLVIKDIQNVNEQNIESYDAFKKQKCVINTQLDVVVADFSMTSYCCNHLGASANKFCPRCHADADNFNEIVRLRTPAETQRTIQRIDMRSNESDKKRLRTLTGVKENDNCFWDVLDPHRDIPVGLLHLIPLGLAKHIIKFVLNNVGSDTVEKLSYHLIDTLGNGYKDFFKHFNSRQGKDLKSYLQIAPFNLLYARVPSKFIDMVTCLANIHKKLNKDSFTSSDYDDLRFNIRQYHEQIKRDAPELKKKVKSHLLLHVVEDIERHGPPKAYVEDAFEKNHGIIRNFLFLQNQQARSRDIAIKFAKHMLCQHVTSGGFFPDGEKWNQATEVVMNLFKEKAVQSYMGVSANIARQAGSISKLCRQTNNHVVLEHQDEDVILQALIALNLQDLHLEQYTIKRGAAMTSNKLELIHSGDWIKYLNGDNEECYGILKEGIIITPKRGPSHQIACIYKASESGNKIMNCPVFQLFSTVELINTTRVSEKAMLIHSCRNANCKLVEKTTKDKVEHEEIIKRKTVLVHNTQHNFYILNIYKL